MDITNHQRTNTSLDQRINALIHGVSQESAVLFHELFDLDTIQRIQDEFAAATGVASYGCSGSTCTIASCSAGLYDVNGTYSDGCECSEDSYGSIHTCATARDLGDISSGGSTTVSGRIIPGSATDDDWFRVDFPASGRPGGGRPTIALTGASASNFSLQVASNCSGGSLACGDGGILTSLQEYEFTDNVVGSGWTVNGTSWPSTVYFRVTRNSTATSCSAAAYTVSITR